MRSGRTASVLGSTSLCAPDPNHAEVIQPQLHSTVLPVCREEVLVD